MTYKEVIMWCKYREKYGSLGPVRRYDQPAAIIASVINNVHGGKAKPVDYMPYMPKPEVIDDLNEEDFIAAISKGAKIGR